MKRSSVPKHAPDRGRGRVVILFALPLMVFALGIGAGTAAPTSHQKTHMKPFVLIFRRDQGPLSDPEKGRLRDQMVPWISKESADGRNLEPRGFGAESVFIGPEGHVDKPSHPDALTSTLYLEAEDFPDAEAVAKSHPALGFGYSIEIREWFRPQGIK